MLKLATATNDNEDDTTASMTSSATTSSYEDTDDEYYMEWRQLCVREMCKIEASFCDVKTLYYDERIQQVDTDLTAVETSSGYVEKVERLKHERQQVIKMNRYMRKLKISQINVILTAEKFANQQNSNNEKDILIGRFNTKLDKLQRNLENDREDAELVTVCNKERKVMCSNPVQVNGPYIVYMLREADIIQDCIAIKRAINVRSRRIS